MEIEKYVILDPSDHLQNDDQFQKVKERLQVQFYKSLATTEHYTELKLTGPPKDACNGTLEERGGLLVLTTPVNSPQSVSTWRVSSKGSA